MDQNRGRGNSRGGRGGDRGGGRGGRGASRGRGGGGDNRGAGFSGRGNGYRGNRGGGDGHGGQRREFVDNAAQQFQAMALDNPGPAERRQIQGAGPRRRELPDSLQIYNTRPESTPASKQGKWGSTIALRSNYFKVTRPLAWSIYQYNVSFAPDIEVTKIRKALLRPFKSKYEGYLFDGSSLFTNKKLDDHEIPTERQDGSIVIIKLKYVNQILPTEQTFLQVLNCILRSCMDSLNLQIIRRQYFDMESKTELSQYRLKIIPGFMTSIRQHENDILLNADLTSKVMRTDTLLDVHRLILSSSRPVDYKSNFAREVLGMIVFTTYSEKTYRITDIDWDKNPKSEFDTKEGKISYIQYYRKRYSVNIVDEKQPLLLSKPTERQKRSNPGEDMIYLIPELCRPCGLTDRMRSDFNLMRAVSDVTRVGPADRQRRLVNLNQRILQSDSAQQILKEWHMKLSPEFIKINGRQLEPINIHFQRPKSAEEKGEPFKNCDWTDHIMKKKTLFEAHNLATKDWVMIFDKNLEVDANNFVKVLIESVRNTGLRFERPRMIPMAAERFEYLRKALELASNGDPKMIMVMLRSQKMYSEVKRHCCVDRKILSQVVLQKTATKPTHVLRSICTKIGIQISTKLGKVPWLVMPPKSCIMFAGFDVCHDTMDKSKSYGALVTTMDQKTSTKFFSAVNAHRNGEELSNQISVHLNSALDQYIQDHGKQGNLTGYLNIIFYRDGVGEGQLTQVHTHEVATIENGIKQRFPGLKYGLTFIVVCKRINTRIFTDSNKNPPPGTLVDDVITQPERYDFYLVSQNVNIGTATPTSYNIIYDTSTNLDTDKIQRVTWGQCHGYYNWSGTVRVPAVCQYAHKLAFLCGQHLHQNPHPHFRDTLYFL